MINKFKVIEIMNKAMIETLKEKNNNYDVNVRIKENLKDEAYFFKIEKEEALYVLRNVGIKEEKLETVYNSLISADLYYNLVNRGKINPEDNSLTVKYKKYIPGEIFKNRNGE